MSVTVLMTSAWRVPVYRAPKRGRCGFMVYLWLFPSFGTKLGGRYVPPPLVFDKIYLEFSNVRDDKVEQANEPYVVEV